MRAAVSAWTRRAAPLLAATGALAWSACQARSTAPHADPPARPAVTSPGRVRAEFLGAATVLLDDGDGAIMTDGFFTRPSLARMATSPIASDPARVDEALGRADVHHLAALLVSHSHLDHAIDSAAVAERTGAPVYGSPSTANVLRGAGLPERDIHVFTDGERLSFGRWRVRVFRTPHSPPVTYPGEITAPLRQPARAGEFKEGGSYSFWVGHGARSVLIVPSAGFTPGKFAGVHADAVFLAIGGLGKQDEAFADAYWREAVQGVGAKVVVPIHWDDFTRPLSEPLQPLPKTFDDFDKGMTMILDRAKRDGVRVILPTAFTPLDVGL